MRGLLLAGFLILFAACRSHPPRAALFDPREEGRAALEWETVGRPLPDPADLLPPGGPYRLGPGDEIVIYRLNARENDPNASLRTFVMPDGFVHFDLAPPVLARGRTVGELSAALTEALRPYYRRPDVSAVLHAAKSRRYAILGKVNSPNVYQLDQPTTLLDAIARAGGIELAGGTGTTEELADLSRALLSRDGRLLPVDFEALVNRGDMRFNVYLHDQDFIFLPPKSTLEILVLGGVGTPKAVGWREGQGLIGAISEADGLLPNAYTRRVLLIRGSFTEPRVAVINLADILRGRATDVPVLPGDVLYIPNSPWERLERYIDVIVSTAAFTVAANEGVRFVEGADGETVRPDLPQP
ncbi:MAG: SLBB domain-containing protein [Opitutales bacterium]|nr:SLBB domain-containing protein [Opitutales bacterium]